MHTDAAQPTTTPPAATGTSNCVHQGAASRPRRTPAPVRRLLAAAVSACAGELLRGLVGAALQWLN